MSSIIKYSFFLCLIATFPFEQSHATKCFAKTDLLGIKELFPVVIKGKVVERTSLKHRKDSFLLRIRVLETVKGKFDQKYVTVEELHLGASNLGNHVYEVGDERYFPISERPNEKVKSVYLPADGCPALPK